MSDKFGDLKIATYEVTGLVGSGLLMNNPAKMIRSTTNGIGPKVIPTPEDEAKAGAYQLPSGQLYVTSTHFRGSILSASSGQKINKKAASQILAASLFSVSEILPLYHPTPDDPLKEYEIDVQRAVVQKAGIMRARAFVPLWSTTVQFQYEPMLINPQLILDVFVLAGVIAGILDYRPNKKGGFGRYSVKLVAN